MRPQSPLTLRHRDNLQRCCQPCAGALYPSVSGERAHLTGRDLAADVIAQSKKYENSLVRSPSFLALLRSPVLCFRVKIAEKAIDKREG
jgi:hypothetical protein